MDGYSPDESKDFRMHEFVQLYSSHTRRLYAYILCLVPNWSDAEDILQDTASIMWSKFAEFTPGTDFLAWACRIARLVVANYYRKRKVRKREFYLNDALLESIARVARSSRIMYQDHRIDALQHCLGKLRDKDQTLIRWRYESGSSIQRIAEAIGRSIDAVYKSLSRIHYQLMVCIEHTLRTEDV